MSNELTVKKEVPFISFGELEKMADAIAKSGLFGMKTKEQATSLLLMSQAEGLHPAMAVRDYHIFGGKANLKADSILARFQAAGGSVEWKCYTDQKVTGVFSHPQGGSLEVTWTIEMAKRAKLIEKDNWKNYPRAMLRSRVASEGCRAVFPGCCNGLHTPDEIGDGNESGSGLIDLVLPGGKVYKSFENLEEWEESYNELCGRITQSTKITEVEKAKKITMLDECNQEVLAKITDQFELPEPETIPQKPETPEAKVYMSEPQRKKIYACLNQLVKEGQITSVDQAKAEIYARFQVESLNDLTTAEAAQVIDRLENGNDPSTSDPFAGGQ